MSRSVVCAIHAGPPFTAIRGPAPSIHKTHRSMTNYREPVQPASRPRNPIRLTIHLRKKRRLVIERPTREPYLRTIQPPELACKTKTVCIQDLQEIVRRTIPNASSRRLMPRDFPPTKRNKLKTFNMWCQPWASTKTLEETCHETTRTLDCRIVAVSARVYLLPGIE